MYMYEVQVKANDLYFMYEWHLCVCLCIYSVLVHISFSISFLLSTVFSLSLSSVQRGVQLNSSDYIKGFKDLVTVNKNNVYGLCFVNHMILPVPIKCRTNNEGKILIIFFLFSILISPFVICFKFFFHFLSLLHVHVS